MGIKNRRFLSLNLIFIFFYIILLCPLLAQDAQEAVYEERVLYVFMDSAGKYQIGIMKTDGSSKKALTKSGNNWAPAVVNDGTQVVFYSDVNGHANLWIVDVNGRNLAQVTENDEDIAKIDLYNPGQTGYLKEDDKIIYLSKNDIWKVDRDGTNPSAVTRYHDVNGFRISPDNAQILFSREKTAKHNGLYTMHANSTNERQVESCVILRPAFD